MGVVGKGTSMGAVSLLRPEPRLEMHVTFKRLSGQLTKACSLAKLVFASTALRTMATSPPEKQASGGLSMFRGSRARHVHGGSFTVQA